MVIQPPPGKKLIVRFNELDIQQLQTGQCLDALVAIDGQDQASARLLQGNYMYLTYLKSFSSIAFLYYASEARHIQFQILYIMRDSVKSLN